MALWKSFQGIGTIYVCLVVIPHLCMAMAMVIGRETTVACRTIEIRYLGKHLDLSVILLDNGIIHSGYCMIQQKNVHLHI